MLKSDLQSREFYENMWNSTIRDGHWTGELWNRTKGGDIYAEMLTINAIRNASGEVEQYVGLFRTLRRSRSTSSNLNASRITMR